MRAPYMMGPDLWIPEPPEAESHIFRGERLPGMKFHPLAQRECVSQSIGADFPLRRQRRDRMLVERRREQTLIHVREEIT